MRIDTILCLFPILVLCCLSACEPKNELEQVSRCVALQIYESPEELVGEGVLSIDQWVIDGKDYYYYTWDCCDRFNRLYDADCNYICAPSGGITGRGDKNCGALQQADYERRIWTNSKN